MKIYLPIFSLIIMINTFESSIGQNLVPNPSFEEYTSCPNDVGQIDSAVAWTIYGNFQWQGPGTPDYYNTCANPTQWPDSLVHVPNNIAGYQDPSTGDAYAGIICYAITVTDGREIIGCPLVSPLQIGQTYFVSFKANCSFGGYMGNYVASNGLGAKFSTVPYSNTNPIPIDNNPIVYSTAVITDTMNWITVEGSFVADSAYQYLAIGNFIQDANLDTIHLGSFIFRSYYYIDDVCVSNNENGCLIGDGTEQLNESEFVILPNPANNVIYVISGEFDYEQIIITNSIGQIVFEKKESFSKAKSIGIDIKAFPAGTYFIVLNDEREVRRQPLLIEH